MRKPLPINRGVIALFSAALIAAVVYHTNFVGHVAYAVERGKLQADIEHLEGIDNADIAGLEQISHAFSIISAVVKPSVVYVEARAPLEMPHEQLRQLFSERRNPMPPRRGIGSGVILDTDGHIITNNHVIADATEIEITLADGREYRAEVVGIDTMTDLAVLKINADRLHPARFGDSDQMKVGNIVLAIGSPFHLGHSVSHGIISALGRGDTMDVDIDYKNWIQTDASINPGNSGGPLINVRGEVIGINTAIATDSGGHQGVGFAIPSNTVSRAADVLKTGEEIQRGYLGVVIKPVSPKVADAYGLPQPGGVFVNNIGHNTPAAKAGLKPEDIILAVNGRNLRSREELQETIAATKPGTVVDMTLWRDGAEIHLDVHIGAQPDGFSTTGSLRDLDRWIDDEDEDSDEQATANRPAKPDAGDDPPDAPSETEVDFEMLGFSADTVSPRLKKTYGLSEDIQNGAIITRVTPTGEAFENGLRPGLVIVRVDKRRIHNVRELEQALTKQAIAKGVRLKFRFGKEVSYTVLRIR